MKLYLITDPGLTVIPKHDEPVTIDFPPKRLFAGNQADARRHRMNFEEKYKPMKPKDRPKVTVEEIDVPTNKDGLLEFLNGL